MIKKREMPSIGACDVASRTARRPLANLQRRAIRKRGREGKKRWKEKREEERSVLSGLSNRTRQFVAREFTARVPLTIVRPEMISPFPSVSFWTKRDGKVVGVTRRMPDELGRAAYRSSSSLSPLAIQLLFLLFLSFFLPSFLSFPQPRLPATMDRAR